MALDRARRFGNVSTATLPVAWRTQLVYRARMARSIRTPLVCAVYVIQHRQSGKMYVGGSCDVFRRFQAHLSLLRGHRHSNLEFQAAFDRDGVMSLCWTVVDVCDRANVVAAEAALLAKIRSRGLAFGSANVPGYGPANGCKLTPADHVAIRARSQNGEMTKTLAAEYGVHLGTIRRIRVGFTGGLSRLPDGRSTPRGRKLTRDNVLEIRRRAANGEHHCALAREFNITSTMARFIVQRITWKSVALQA